MRARPSQTPTAAGLVCTAVLAVLAGCASAPSRLPGAAPSAGREAVLASDGRDGADAHPPAGLEHVPDAQPRVEAVRPGGPNKPYEVFGVSYVPWTQDRPFREHGLASWYGRKFHGRRTSSGEPYDMYAMTAAHPTLPIPSYARVRNPANGREIVVRVNDRGPFHRGRIIDLSYTAALKLGVLRGVAPVEVERITFDEIRAGADRGAVAPRDRAAEAAPPPPAATGSAAPEPVAFEPIATAPVPGAFAAPADAALPVPSAPAAPGALPSSPALATTSAPTASAPAAGFWVQLGAFRQFEAAAAFQRRVAAELAGLSPRLSVVDQDALFRLQAGPYATQDDARGAAAAIRAALRLVPLIVDRR